MIIHIRSHAEVREVKPLTVEKVMLAHSEDQRTPWESILSRGLFGSIQSISSIDLHVHAALSLGVGLGRR